MAFLSDRKYYPVEFIYVFTFDVSHVFVNGLILDIGWPLNEIFQFGWHMINWYFLKSDLIHDSTISKVPIIISWFISCLNCFLNKSENILHEDSVHWNTKFYMYTNIYKNVF